MGTRATLLAATAAVVGLGLAVPQIALAQDNRNGAVMANGELSVPDLFEKVSPAVVAISVETELEIQGVPDGFDELPEEFRFFFRQFGDQFDEPRTRRGQSAGSGFFISADGYVVTNHHVIDNGTNITISMTDGEEFDAVIVGSDEASDLAVLKVEGDDFPYVTFAEDLDIRVGEEILAVGNPFGLSGSASKGIVSALGRETPFSPTGRYTPFIQIDAPINRGNSGGPTFNLRGEVIGVNSQIISPSGGNVGIGFAIPADFAADIVDRLIADGSIRRGWLGVSIRGVDEAMAAALGRSEAGGAIVEQVVEGGPAEDAGFRRGDVVLDVEGNPVNDSIDLTRQVGDLEIGDRVDFTVYRDGRERTLTVRIGERPGEDGASAGASSSDDDGGVTAQLGVSLRAATQADRERLGLEDGEPAVIVTDVDRDSEAARQGIRRGNAIVSVNGEDVGSVRAFTRAVDAAKDAGREAVLVTIHDGRMQRFAPLRLDGED